MLGDNGAGKSTLMKCIAGVITPDSGKILFDNIDITKITPAGSRGVGIEMIFQDLGLCRKQSVLTNVFLGHEYRFGPFLNRKKMRQECDAAFASLGIEVAAGALVGTLSGGQQQSIAIARSMISKPRLLIMDEPTAALAAKESERVLNHILKVKQQGTTVIMISHNLSEVLRVADKIIIMKHGIIKYQVTPSQTNIKELTEKIIGE